MFHTECKTTPISNLMLKHITQGKQTKPNALFVLLTNLFYAMPGTIRNASKKNARGRSSIDLQPRQRDCIPLILLQIGTPNSGVPFVCSGNTSRQVEDEGIVLREASAPLRFNDSPAWESSNFTLGMSPPILPAFAVLLLTGDVVVAKPSAILKGSAAL